MTAKGAARKKSTVDDIESVSSCGSDSDNDSSCGAELPKKQRSVFNLSLTTSLGCQLLSNSNLILGVTVTGTFPCYCVNCDYCFFFK